ncbi:uncharacterized protein PAC_18110 [Phialocephala subalpina]|uniref:Uncharacterized protein n=1 Tax=Phialocephala subalpina TaxID=576137 RepID=A0A1L7XT57_9HELO|nr:uncharacterized protein PAC_18110 [Phialocephala subalpina]
MADPVSITGSASRPPVMDETFQRWEISMAGSANVGIFKQGQIKAISEQLSNCKLTINSIMTKLDTAPSATAISRKRSRRRYLQSRVRLRVCRCYSGSTAGSVRKQAGRAEPQQRWRRSGWIQGNKTEALRQFEEEYKGVKASQKLLNELLSKSQEEAVAKAVGNQSGLITVTFGAQNSGFQARHINGGVSGTAFGRKQIYDIYILMVD